VDIASASFVSPASGDAMKPDLILRAGRSDLAVGDAKYKEPDDQRPSNEDLYQLLAYCVSLGLRRGLLIYSGKLNRQYLVQRAGIKLEATSVDLTRAIHFRSKPALARPRCDS
jgi:5-methylcytosine-specific restriction enzyme subunit McrC